MKIRLFAQASMTTSPHEHHHKEIFMNIAEEFTICGKVSFCRKKNYYVVTVLPFGWKTSPVVYHTVTDAVRKCIRSLGIPMLCWIDDMLGWTEQSSKDNDDETQFQSAMRAMVVATHILFQAGYF